MFLLAQQTATSTGFIQDLAIVMTVAGGVTLLFHRIRQPVILGYILAGFLIGPNLANFVYHVTRPRSADIAPVATSPAMGIRRPDSPAFQLSLPPAATAPEQSTPATTAPTSRASEATTNTSWPTASPTTLPDVAAPTTEPDSATIEPATAPSPTYAHYKPRGLIQDDAIIRQLSDMGVVLLMFSMGLQFSFHKLFKVGPTAMVAATLEISLMVWIGYQVGLAFGWSRMDALFLGATLLSSSTIIIVRTLRDMGLAKERFAELIFGILVIDDMFAITALALLSTIAMSGKLSAGEVVSTVTRLVIFLSVVFVVGMLAVPRLVQHVTRFRSKEMLLVTVLALCFGVALLALQLGFSVALGAFLIGAILAETRQRGLIEALIEPIRDMFSAVFFVAIGMLFNPIMLLDHWPTVLLMTFVVIVGKTLTGAFGSFVVGNDARTSLKVGMGLAQIGEFAFIISALGVSLGVTSEFLFPIAVSVSTMTCLLTPYLLCNADSVIDAMHRFTPRRLAGPLVLYSEWIMSEGNRTGAQEAIRRLVRRAVLQVGINMALTAAVFLATPWLTVLVPGMKKIPAWAGGPNTSLWLIAMVASLPMLVATVRKLRAMSMLLGELSVTRTAAGTHTAFLRNLVANTSFVGMMGMLGFLLLVLSSAIMPPWRALLVAGVAIMWLVVFKWKSFAQLYSKAQVAVNETLEDESQDLPDELDMDPKVSSMLSSAKLETVEIGPDSKAAGKLIRELALRTKVGASAVVIERAGVSIVNPGPDEELLPGDRVLLLGNVEQLAKARLLFLGTT